MVGECGAIQYCDDHGARDARDGHAYRGYCTDGNRGHGQRDARELGQDHAHRHESRRHFGIRERGADISDLDPVEGGEIDGRSDFGEARWWGEDQWDH